MGINQAFRQFFVNFTIKAPEFDDLSIQLIFMFIVKSSLDFISFIFHPILPGKVYLFPYLYFYSDSKLKSFFRYNRILVFLSKTKCHYHTISILIHIQKTYSVYSNFNFFF